MEAKDETNFLDTAVTILNCMDTDSSSDEEIMLGIVDICEDAFDTLKKKKKRNWIKQWRKQRPVQGSFSFLTSELKVNDSESFFNYLRMNEKTFDLLLLLIENDIKKENTMMRDAISPPEKLAATLRFLATAIPEVCAAIWKNLKGSYLKFPESKSEWEQIAEDFAIRWQFPNCLGALDGKHVAFRSLRKDGAYYHNYKGTNSIILLALADANCRLIYVDIGSNGRTNDAGVLLQSSLKNVLDDAPNKFPHDRIVGDGRVLPFVIVGDDAFPLQKHIMKPYPFRTQSKTKRIFNVRLSRARHVVEHTFGIMSNRFKILQSTMNLRVEQVQVVTKACCVLHNFLMKHNSNETNSLLASFPTTSTNIKTQEIDNPRKGAAEAIRCSFAEYFCNEGQVEWQNKQI
ncbi:uncharacterized protein LOC129951565 isoform X2 [Eupeodes corollae]|uniref:uncharacterized protein LOC129951565 isoform X2 n=1 Tax=Eupeodes corollae TaxID=290404 RepID=UPI00248F6204|nr:uncharacterized protein LOC129951565 isoform X2 [Eupeodes corollae]